jgi:(p)ppGpp synthase/HD superfamily hydrolase
MRYDVAMTKEIASAIEIAVLVHAKQTDKGGAPYINHALAVGTQAALRCGGNEHDAEVRLMAGVLHDTLEDAASQGFDRDYIAALIAARCGPTVLRAVQALTREDGEVYADFIDRCAQNPIARDVKIADVQHNSDPNRRVPGQNGPNRRYVRALATLAQED